jgi:two-component system nitrate/nitrite sensor histidine kinase NarX
MRSYHIAFLLTQQVRQPSESLRQDIKAEVAQFEKVLFNLDRGDPRRPLALPKDKIVREQMGKLHQVWQADLKPRIQRILDTPLRSNQENMLAEYKHVVERYVSNVNELVSMVETSNARAATLLRSFQIGLVSVALVGTVLMMNLFLLIVVRPVNRLREGIQRMGRGDFSVRLKVTKHDEFGELADGFNQMADQLQNLYVTRNSVKKNPAAEMKIVVGCGDDVPFQFSTAQNHCAGISLLR